MKDMPPQISTLPRRKKDKGQKLNETNSYGTLHCLRDQDPGGEEQAETGRNASTDHQINSKKTIDLTAVSSWMRRLQNSTLSLWDDQCLGSGGRRVDACSMKLDYVCRTPKLSQGKVCHQLIGQGSETGGIPDCLFIIDQFSGSWRRRVDTQVTELDKTPPQNSKLPSS